MLLSSGESLAQSTLRLGDHVVLVADGGVPEAEYALFDPGDIELGATEPGIVREVGFRTVVGTARERLEVLGVGAAEAREAAEAVRPTLSRAYARGAAVRRIAQSLNAVELFDGGMFRASAGGYVGSWLDLAALSKDLGLAGASGLLQCLHLAALLAEHDDDEPLILSTAEVTATRKAGERTYRRPRMADPREVLRALATLKPAPTRRCDAGPGPQEVLAQLRSRPRKTPASRDRLKAVEGALAAREAPTGGPLVDPELWAIELSLSEGETRLASATIDAVEQRQGRIPATAYLRARAALIGRTEPARAIAERASALSTSMPDFHELWLLSAQAWAAAGEPRRAAAFARDLVDNASAPDAIRMQAQDILDGAPPSRTSLAALPRAAPESAARVPTIPPPPSTPSSRTSLRPGAAFTAEAAGTASWSVPPPALAGGEPLESLGLPAGALDTGEPPLTPGDVPRTPLEARIHCTLLTRELGRSLREEGAEPRCDIEGLEIAQRYLREALPEAGTRPLRPEEQRYVTQHGAFLSELLARKLGARWVDLASPDAQRWAMLVPSVSRSELTRVWPFARVARFAVMGHRERDLVSYYLEIEARTRGT
jgi:hypothetical protein